MSARKALGTGALQVINANERVMDGVSESSKLTANHPSLSIRNDMPVHRNHSPLPSHLAFHTSGTLNWLAVHRLRPGICAGVCCGTTATASMRRTASSLKFPPPDCPSVAKRPFAGGYGAGPASRRRTRVSCSIINDAPATRFYTTGQRAPNLLAANAFGPSMPTPAR